MNVSANWSVARGYPRYFSNSAEIGIFLMYSVLFVTSSLANTAIVVAIATNKRLMSVTHVLIANLAVGDLLMSVPLVFTPLQAVLGRWEWGRALCSVFGTTAVVGVLISSFTLAAIAIYRHVVILHIRRLRKKSSRGLLTSATIWLLSALVAVPTALAMQLRKRDSSNSSTTMVCVESWTSAQAKQTYNIAVLLLQFVVPSSIMLFCHMRIHLYLRNRLSVIASRAQTSLLIRRMGNIKRRKRIQCILLLMVITYLICWLPLHIFTIMLEHVKVRISNQKTMQIYVCVHFLAMTSTVLNPLLYALWNPEVRCRLFCRDAFPRPMLRYSSSRLMQSRF